MGDAPRGHSGRLGFFDTVRAVGASFFGVRGGRAHRQDFERLNPLHVIIVGVVMAALFVIGLVFVAKAVVHHG